MVIFNVFLLLFFSINRCTSADVATAKVCTEGVGLEWEVSFCTCTGMGTGTGAGMHTVLHCTGDGRRSTALPAPAIAIAGEWALSSVGSVFGSTPSTSERKACNETRLQVSGQQWLLCCGCMRY